MTDRLPALTVLLPVLLGAAFAGSFDAGAEELGPPDFVTSCPDGHAGCDKDGEADGICTFGGDEGRSIRIPVGESRKVENVCHVVGLFSCDPPVLGPPVVLTPPEAGELPKFAAREPEGEPAARSGRPSMLDGCRRSSDCVPTKEDGCVHRDMLKPLQDRWNRNVSCRCVKVGGAGSCVARGSDWEKVLLKMAR